MTQNQGVLGEDAVVRYVETGQSYDPTVTVHLDSADLLASDLHPLADKATEELAEHVTEAKPEVRRDGAVILLTLKPTGRYSDNYMPEGRQEALVRALAPTHTRKVRASATVVRNKDGRHTGTRVTITLDAGEVLKGLNVKQYDGQDGVLRARVSSDAHSLVFTMSEPAANDDDGKITKVVESLAGKVGAMVVKPITVTDPNPDAALDPANDYVAPVSVES